jgi:hypothetical protein
MTELWPQLPTEAGFHFNMQKVTLVFIVLTAASMAFILWHREPAPPVASPQPQMMIVNTAQVARESYKARLLEIIARANSAGDKAVFGETKFVYENGSINTPPLLLPMRAHQSGPE